MAEDSFAKGRISAVSITDNPGGNPSLSRDVLGHHIFRVGIDVIVHDTSRDLNRLGTESRGSAKRRAAKKSAYSLYVQTKPVLLAGSNQIEDVVPIRLQGGTGCGKTLQMNGYPIW